LGKPLIPPMNRAMKAHGKSSVTTKTITSTAPAKSTNKGSMTANGGYAKKMAGVGSKPDMAFRDGKY